MMKSYGIVRRMVVMGRLRGCWARVQGSFSRVEDFMRQITVASPTKAGRRKNQKRRSRRNRNHLTLPGRDLKATVGRAVEAMHPRQIERIMELSIV